MEPRHLIDNPIRSVCSDVDLSSVRSDGEEVGGPVEGADCHPPAVPADRDVLHTGRGGSTEEGVEVVHGRLTTQPRVRDQVEDVEQVALCTGCH